VGAVGVELLWNGGSAVGVSSSEFTRGGGDVLGSGSNEQAKGRAEWDAGVYVVLVRALGEGGGLCSGLATVAARWRPRGRLCARRGAWHGREGRSAKQEAVE